MLYNHQTLCILAKIGPIITISSLKHSFLQEIINFSQQVYCTYKSSTNENKCIFFSYLMVYNFSGHVEGSCMGTNILIISAYCNHQICKPRCIDQVLKFPNQSPNYYSQSHPFLRLSSAGPSCENIKCYFCQLTSEKNHVHTDNLTHCRLTLHLFKFSLIKNMKGNGGNQLAQFKFPFFSILLCFFHHAAKFTVPHFIVYYLFFLVSFPNNRNYCCQ